MPSETYWIMKKGEGIVQRAMETGQTIRLGSVADFEKVLARVRKRVEEQNKKGVI